MKQEYLIYNERLHAYQLHRKTWVIKLDMLNPKCTESGISRAQRNIGKVWLQKHFCICALVLAVKPMCWPAISGIMTYVLKGQNRG